MKGMSKIEISLCILYWHETTILSTIDLMYQASYQLKPGWSQKEFPIWVLASYQPDVLNLYQERLHQSRKKDINHTITMTVQDQDWQHRLIECLSHQDLLQEKTLIQIFGAKKSDLNVFQHPFFQHLPRLHECHLCVQDVSLRSLSWIQKHRAIMAIDCYAPQAASPAKIKQALAQHGWQTDQSLARAICQWQHERPNALQQLIRYCQQHNCQPNVEIIQSLTEHTHAPQVSDVMIACLKGSKSAIKQLESMGQDSIHQCYWLTLQYSRFIIECQNKQPQPIGLFKRPDIKQLCLQCAKNLSHQSALEWHRQLLELEPLLKGLLYPLDYTFAAAQLQHWWLFIQENEATS